MTDTSFRPPSDLLETRESPSQPFGNDEILRLMLGSVRDFAIFATDVEGRILSWNPGVRHLLGYDEAEFIGQDASLIFTPEDLENGAPQREMATAAGQGQAEDERWHRRRDGTLFWASGLLMGLRDEGGHLRGFAKMMRDGTAHKQEADRLAASIIERQAAADALRQSEQRYRSLVAASAQIVWIARPNGQVEDIPAWRDLTGQSPDEVQGWGWLDAIHPDDRERTLRVWGQSVQNKSICVTEYRVRRHDGSYVFFAVRGVPILDDDGSVIEWIGACTDISERKHTEDLLRRSEEQHRAISELTSDYAYSAEVQPDGTFVIEWVTEAFNRICGYSVEEINAMGWHNTLLPGDLPIVQSQTERLLNGQSSVSEHRLKTKSGQIRWIRNYARPIWDEEAGRVTRFYGAGQDITERKQSEAEREKLLDEVQEANALLDTLFNNAPLGIGVWDRDLRYVRINQALAEINGVPVEEHIGKTVSQVLPDLDPGVLRVFRQVIEEGVALVDQEVSGVTPAEPGKQRFWSLNCYPVQLRGEVVGAGAICEEITAKKELEAEREQLLRREQEARRRAEEASRLKDEFLATVSHELRTPLTAMLGWAHLLRNGGLDEESSRQALDTIERNARAQKQLIEDLLDVSRIITGKLRLDVRTLDPISFIEAAIEAVQPAAEAKNVRLQKVLDTGTIALSGDPARLQQVVWNLLSNAIKFTPKGGRVQVRLERVNSHVEIVVSDNGMGIKPDFLPFLFDRFRQADATSTREHGGLGLGLAIVRQIVELHGGTVHADSAGETSGATFTLSLPLMTVYRKDASAERVHPAASVAPPEFGPTQRLDGLQILVVDDEADTRHLLQVVLEQCGAAVQTAASVREAFAQFMQAPPTLLISDIGMPDEDGYALIRQVRALPAEAGGKVPAIALTAYARTEDRLHALMTGYQMHVPKPVELAELVAVVSSLAAR